MRVPTASLRARRRMRALAPFAVFAVTIAVLLGPSLVGARVALPHDLHLQQLPWALEDPARPLNPELRDTVDQYYPVQHALLSRLRAGEDARWLREVGFGHLGITFIGWGALSVFNLPALVLPFDLAWSWGQALRLLAAMCGAYVLVRSLGSGRTGATVAGLSFGLSGFVTHWLGWPQAHVAALIPWVLWAVRAAVGVMRPPWWSGPAVALAVAGLWLGGFPAVSVYALLAAAAVALHGLVRARRLGGGAVLSRTVVVGGGVVVGTLLVAFTLVPSLGWLDLMDLSARATALDARVSPAALWTFLLPGVFGDVVHHPRWLGSAYVESIGYAGLVTALLAVPAWVLRPRRVGVWLYTGIGLGAGLLAYGFPPVVAVAARVPALATNPPGRALAVVGLAIAVVGGLGADALLGRIAGRGGLDRVALAVVAAGLAVLVGWLVVAGVVTDLKALALERLEVHAYADARKVALDAAARGAGFVAVAVAAMGIGVLLTRRGRDVVGGTVAATLLVAVVAVDLVSFAGGWNVQVPRADLFPDGPGIAALREASATHRTAGADGAGHANANLEYGIRDLRARGFLTERQRAVLRALGGSFASPTRWDLTVERAADWEPWLSAAGVRAVLAPSGEDAPPPGWTERDLGGVRLLENPAARPLVSAVPHAEAVPFGGAAAALAETGLAGLDGRVRVETPTPLDLPDGREARVESWWVEGSRTRARVSSDGGAVLVALDAAAPGWRATVGGEPADVVTVDHLYLGVVVPPGTHDVELRYRPPGLTTGQLLSGLGLGLLVLSAVGARRRERAPLG